MKSNRLQNKDPAVQNRIGRGVTIKRRLDIKRGSVRPDTLTPTLSHGEREKTLKKATCVAFYVELVRPDAFTPALSYGEREKTHKRQPALPFMLSLFGLMTSSQSPRSGEEEDHFLRDNLNATNRKTIHTGSRKAESRMSSRVHISTRIIARKAIQM
ncbi:Uncharacterised protein [Lelliottia amnigena]|nr:hypothetical protein CCAJJPOJ_03532 [Lelliottia sp. T2.26D-8]VDZ87887.1 Uncharacterised protein [Lelliottia amnigena]